MRGSIPPEPNKPLDDYFSEAGLLGCLPGGQFQRIGQSSEGACQGVVLLFVCELPEGGHRLASLDLRESYHRQAMESDCRQQISRISFTGCRPPRSQVAVVFGQGIEARPSSFACACVILLK